MISHIKEVRKIVMNHIQPLCVYGFYNENKKQMFNIEHIVPQSFDSKVNCDLHMIFMCNRQLNHIRSNYVFIDDLYIKDKKMRNHFIYIIHENGTYYTVMQKRRDYYCGFSNYFGFFLPPEKSKGIIARSLLYYKDKYKNDDVLRKIIDINLLLEWNRKYQVCEMEYKRNEEIFRIQKNRNPFIYFG
jgi:deoxyribonuclease-1